MLIRAKKARVVIIVYVDRIILYDKIKILSLLKLYIFCVNSFNLWLEFFAFMQ